MQKSAWPTGMLVVPVTGANATLVKSTSCVALPAYAAPRASNSSNAVANPMNPLTRMTQSP